jgi:hypothetical protein
MADSSCAAAAIDVAGLVNSSRHRHRCEVLRRLCFFNGTILPYEPGPDANAALRIATSMIVRSQFGSHATFPLAQLHPMRPPATGSTAASLLLRQAEQLSRCVPLVWIPVWAFSFADSFVSSLVPIDELLSAGLINEHVQLRPDLVAWPRSKNPIYRMIGSLSTQPIRTVREVAPKCDGAAARRRLDEMGESRLPSARDGAAARRRLDEMGESRLPSARDGAAARRRLDEMGEKRTRRRRDSEGGARRRRRPLEQPCASTCYERVLVCNFRSTFDPYGPPMAPWRAGQRVARAVEGGRPVPVATASPPSTARLHSQRAFTANGPLVPVATALGDPAPAAAPAFHSSPSQPAFHSSPSQPAFHSSPSQPAFHSLPSTARLPQPASTGPPVLRVVFVNRTRTQFSRSLTNLHELLHRCEHRVPLITFEFP